MNVWVRWIGVLISCISIFNLLRKYLNVGLSPIIQDLITFYQNIFFPFVDAIKYMQPFVLFINNASDWEKDYRVLFVLLCSISTKIVYSNSFDGSVSSDQSSNIKSYILEFIAIYLIFFFISFLFTGVVIVFYSDFSLKYIFGVSLIWLILWYVSVDPDDVYSKIDFLGHIALVFLGILRILRETFYIMCAVAILFIINFYTI